MALIKCGECGKDVSTQSKTCPSCGAKVKLPKKPTSPILKYLLLGVVGLFIVIGVVNGIAHRDDEKADQARLNAMTPEQRSDELIRRQAAAAAETRRVEAEGQAKSDFDARQNDIGMAEVSCQMVAEKQANDPSSVDWLTHERQFAYTSPDKTKATSIQPMRAKNAMGGLVRTAVKCNLAKRNGSWNVVSFTEAK